MAIVAATGFFVPLFEDAATAIAAGVVIGGFAGASSGFMRGWSRKQVEGNGLRDGYIGALVAGVGWLVDLCNVYASSI